MSGKWVLSWSQMRDGLRADKEHWKRRGISLPQLHRGYHAIVLYRLARLAHECGFKFIGWGIWIFNNIWTKADLPPSSKIGRGLFLPHPIGVVISGAIGCNAYIGMQVGVGGLLKAPERDIGGGPGLPVIGNNVIIEPRVLVLGLVQISDNITINPGSIILNDINQNNQI
ncbi:serine acetyltransferase [Methylobacterium sp. WL122]|nr:serine acetyltransferase [Methylobacterium sp. WL122]